MRDFSKTFSQFWTGRTGREIQALGKDAVILAMYLLTSRHAHMFGMYYLPVGYIANDTGLKKKEVEGALKALGRGFEGASKGLRRGGEGVFMVYDAPSEWVFVPEMAKWQLLKNGEALKEGDKRVVGYRKEYAAMPSNPFLYEFYDKYKDLLRLDKGRGEKPLPRPIEGASKPLDSPSEAIEIEKEIEKERDTRGRAKGPPPSKPEKRKDPKDSYGEFENVMLTEVEYCTILAKLGNIEAEKFIGELSRAMASDAKLARKYTNHCATVLAWYKKPPLGETKAREYQRVCSEYHKAPKGATGWTHPEAVVEGNERRCPHCKGRQKLTKAASERSEEDEKATEEARKRAKALIDKTLRRPGVTA